MKLLSSVLVLVTVLASGPGASAAGLAARHKPGPVTIRGIAAHPTAHSFTLHSSKGSFTVEMPPATHVTEKGKSGRAVIHDGDHVGVRGFVTGHSITAITIRIYPVKPKPFTVRGTVASVSGSSVVVSTGSARDTIRLTSSTAIKKGRDTGSRGDLHPGGRVRLRVVSENGVLVAQSVYVYVTAVHATHVELSGTLTVVAPGRIDISTGGHSYAVTVPGSTPVYLGSSRASTRALARGESVRVYACCAGQPLSATSIHIHTTKATIHATHITGTVVAVGPASLRLQTSQGVMTVVLTSATHYQVGTASSPTRNVQPGDHVSIHGTMRGSALQATLVHVDASSRTPRTVVGPVAVVVKGGIVVTDRGRRYTLSLASIRSVLVNGRAAPTSSVRVGDHVHATGRLTGSTLAVSSITVTRRATPARTIRVHGTITRVSGGTLTVTDPYGATHQVRLAAHAALRLHGQVAPPGDLILGAAVTAKGQMAGSTLIATSITLSVKTKSVTATVVSVSAHGIVLQPASGGSVRIDVPSGTPIVDGNHQSVTLQRGAEVQVKGLVETSGAIRAQRITVLHPQISASGTASGTSGHLILVTTHGDRYKLRFTTSTTIDTGREQVALTPTTIPVGAHLHVAGTLGSDGSIKVATVTVRLKSDAIRGTVTAQGAGTLTVQSPSGSLQVTAGRQTDVVQGSHVLVLTDIVVGDDVTVYGYDGGASLLLARKIDVHRKLVGMSGTVASLESTGFVLQAADGSHHVLIGPTVIYTGGTAQNVIVGAAVHVTGYLRGDGAVVATRVRIGKAKH